MVCEDEDVHIWVNRGSREKRRGNTKTGNRGREGLAGSLRVEGDTGGKCEWRKRTLNQTGREGGVALLGEVGKEGLK